MDKFNQKFADFFNLDKDCILKDETHIVVENKDAEICFILKYNEKENFHIDEGIHIELLKKDNSNFVTLEFYEKGICTTEYINFEFDDIKTDHNSYINDQEKEVQYKTLSFVSDKNNRLLTIDIYFDYKYTISITESLNRNEFNTLISKLLNTSEAEIDDDGASHYILKNIDNKLVVDTTPIENWNDDLIENSLVLDFHYVYQTISITKYKNKECIGNHDFVVKNIERIDNTLIIYSKNNSSKIEIVLEPVLKIKNIYY